MAQVPFADPNVEAAFRGFPEDVREDLLSLRDMIFDVAADTEGVDALEESLKWGQPSYRPKARFGTAVRLGVGKTGGPALLTHCQTRVMHDFRALFPDAFHYDGNRAIELTDATMGKAEELQLFVKSALTYRRDKV